MNAEMMITVRKIKFPDEKILVLCIRLIDDSRVYETIFIMITTNIQVATVTLTILSNRAQLLTLNLVRSYRSIPVSLSLSLRLIFAIYFSFYSLDDIQLL